MSGFVPDIHLYMPAKHTSLTPVFPPYLEAARPAVRYSQFSESLGVVKLSFCHFAISQKKPVSKWQNDNWAGRTLFQIRMGTYNDENLQSAKNQSILVISLFDKPGLLGTYNDDES
jgi:hypothetical protein